MYCIWVIVIVCVYFQSDTKLVNAAILKVFTKFGQIQSVERVSSSTAYKPDIFEAYIEYRYSEDAYNAFIANRNDSKSSEEVITVLPMNTWKTKRKISPLEELAEMKRRIAYIENEKDKTQFIYKMVLTPGMLLKVFRQFIRESKEQLTGLFLHYELDPLDSDDENDEDDENSSVESDSECKEKAAAIDTDKQKSESKSGPTIETNCIAQHEFEKRIAEVVVKNIGKKFTTLLLKKRSVSKEMLQWFAPVLKQLIDLRIHSDFDCSILYALHEYCPNVRSFHLEGNGWEGEFDQTAAENWPSMKDFYLNISDMDDDILCNEGNRKLQKFIEVNPQIRTLQIDSVVDLEIVTAIGKTLKDLHTLAFVRPNFEGLNSVLDNLTSLTKLHGLKFSALEVKKGDLNALTKCAKRLSRLPELQLITIFMNCEPDYGGGGDGSDNDNDEEYFGHLKDFNISHHQDCVCHGPHRILSFDKKKIEVPENNAVLALIVNTRPPCATKDKTLKATILKAFKKTTKYFPNIVEQTQQAEEDSYLYIQISSNRI